MFLYEAFLYLYDAVSHGVFSFFFHTEITEITEIHRLLRIASLALGLRTLNSQLSPLNYISVGLFV